MIVKELWIMLKSGLNLFHYQTLYSDYQNLDSLLFSGFITALSEFAMSMSNKQIEFLKLQIDELYFVIKDAIIVTSIIDATQGIEKNVLTQLLDYIGEKFLEMYASQLKNNLFNWDTIEEEFSHEIKLLITDQGIYEELKRELINSLFNQVLNRKLSPDVLHWKLTELSTNNAPDEIVKTLGIIENLIKILPATKSDVIIQSKVEDSLQTVQSFLLKKLTHEKYQLFVLCSDDRLFEEILGTFLVYGIICNQFRTFEALYKSIKTVNDTFGQFGYPVLLANPTISSEEILLVTNLCVQTKVFYWSTEKPTDNLLKLSVVKENFSLLPHVRCLFTQGCPKIQDVLKDIKNSSNLIEQIPTRLR